MAKAESTFTFGTGRRKSATARVRIKAGTGVAIVNGLPSNEYFVTDAQRYPVAMPFAITETVGKFDFYARVNGGGKDAQAGAIRLGLARALVSANEELAPKLKEANMLTRDPRMKERKKYGQHGARKGTQFSKR